jgi:hypothetical protein
MPTSRTRKTPSTSRKVPCQDEKRHLPRRTHDLTSYCTARPQPMRKTRTTGIAATVRPNSVEFLARTRMRSCKNHLGKITIKVYANTYLHGNAGKGKEVEFQEANQHLVVLVHCLVIGRQDSHSQQCRTH